MSFANAVAVTILSFAASLACAEGKTVEIKNAWLRATVPGQQVAAAYMEIRSATAATIVKVETTAAKVAEIHSMKMEDGVMRMQHMASLPLPARKIVKLSPGGHHLMLTGLKQPLKVGDKVPIKLTVKGADGRPTVLAVNALVKKIEAD
ncbi:MAG: copper chaperone PCu(A)C [Burkholderiales bacterium]|nr:copper chaperone PCu(A)C [Burkholderiales bacterium]